MVHRTLIRLLKSSLGTLRQTQGERKKLKGEGLWPPMLSVSKHEQRAFELLFGSSSQYRFHKADPSGTVARGLLKTGAMSERRKSRAELVFSVLKALDSVRRFWGPTAAMPLRDLATATEASIAEVAGVIAMLRERGWVCSDRESTALRLTRRGRNEIDVTDQLPCEEALSDRSKS